MLASQQANGILERLTGSLFEGLTSTGQAVVAAKILAPLDPAAILCIGLNYRKHAEEGKQPIPQNPVLFMKTATAVQNPGDPIVLPRKLRSDKVDYECELAVIIGKRCYNVSRADALSHVLGYSCANDVSARDWQKEGGGGQWCRGKTFATFCPLGPCLVTADEIPDPNALQIRTVLNGNTMQDWNTNDMIFDVPTLIEFLEHKQCSLGTSIYDRDTTWRWHCQNTTVFLQPGRHGHNGYRRYRQPDEPCD